MNEKKKELIRVMRREGNSYTKIAQKLNLSENTVKSYCMRNNLGGTGMSLLLSAGLICRNCEKPIKQSPGHKQRKFCSDICRIKWWNTHPEHVDKKAVYFFCCAGCGQLFTAYGNANRKYCSHKCYINDRFSKKEEADVLP